MTQHYPKAEQYMASTHDVENQPKPLENYNLYLADKALQQAVEREGASWACSDLIAFGELAGKKKALNLAFRPTSTNPNYALMTATDIVLIRWTFTPVITN